MASTHRLAKEGISEEENEKPSFDHQIANILKSDNIKYWQEDREIGISITLLGTVEKVLRSVYRSANVNHS